jgi:DNA polymerase
MLELRRSSVVTPVETAATHVLHRDYETRSRLDLRKVGAFIYAADASTQVLCAAYAVDDDPVQLWWPGDPIPLEFKEAATDPAWIACAHNNQFERCIEKYVLRSLGWPPIPAERHRCTQTMCLAAGLPAKLSAAAEALELENRKDAAGERLMHQLSKPRKAHKDEDPAGVFWFDDPDRLQRLGEYCKQDLEVERELYGRLPPLSRAELALWVLSNQINARGFRVDRPFALAARKIAQAVSPEIDAELNEITGGAVGKIGQVAKMREWLAAQGCPLPSLDRDTIEQALENQELPSQVCRVLELRLSAAQAATKKIDALLARAGSDDRVRGSFKHHGAATGRWSGEGFQPQNLKSPITEDLIGAIEAVSTGDYQHMKAKYAKPLSVIGDCIRSTIIAAPGHALFGGDFSSIESRILAWLSGEGWKLEAYRRYDATRDPRDEPYCATACKIFRKPPGSFDKSSPERGVGKIADLAFGYMGGLSAWRNFAPDDRFTDAEVETFKTEWRAAHPETNKFWYQIDDSAVLAMSNPGQVVRCGGIDLKYAGSFLRIKLPSGRKLSYPQPRLIVVEDKNGRPKSRVVFRDNSAGRFVDCRGGAGAYGGLWTENIVSGIARDLLAAAMLRVEAAGYPIVLHVHDELVCEVPIGFGSVEEFTHLMTRKPAWALDLPIAASAWTGPRYCK